MHSITLFFPASFGGGSTRVNYIGFKGVNTGVRRGVVDAVYESKPMPSDHSTRAGAGAGTLGM